jgi:general secretion pathway protein K
MAGTVAVTAHGTGAMNQHVTKRLPPSQCKPSHHGTQLSCPHHVTASRMRSRDRQRGIALVMVLWLLVLLSVIAASHARNIRTETRLATNQVEAARARALAEAGASHAILELLVRDDSVRWLTDGTLYPLAFHGGTVAVAIRDTRGLIDLNTVDALLLDKVLTALGVDQPQRDKLIGATLDWRDHDSLKHDNGAEDDDYRLAGMQWGVRDGAFSSIEEYRYVMGMTNQIFEQLAPYLCVQSNHRGVSPEYAPPWLREVLGGTEDVPGRNPPVIVRGRNAGSPTYKISLWATTERGSTASLDVVIKLNPAAPQGYTILSWRTPSWSTPGEPG